MTTPTFEISPSILLSQVPGASLSVTKYFGPQADGSISAGLELNISGVNWSNTSLQLLFQPCVIHFVNSGQPLPSPLPLLSFPNDAIVVLPEPATFPALKAFFNAHHKPAPRAFIYQNIKVKFSGADMPAPGGPNDWYQHITRAALRFNELAGLQVVPDGTMLHIKILSEENRFLDPTFFFKFFNRHFTASGPYTMHADLGAFTSFLPDNLIIDVRDEWNDPYNGPVRIQIYQGGTPTPPEQRDLTAQGGLVRVPNGNIPTGDYKIVFDADMSVVPFDGTSSSNEYSFTITDGHKTDYVVLQRINLRDWFVDNVGPDFGHLYTKGNAVEFYIDGKHYFRRIHDLLNQNCTYVFFTNWRLDYDFDLLLIPEGTPRSDYHSRASTIGNLLARPGMRHKVYGTLWDQKSPNPDFVYINEYAVNDNAFVALNDGIAYDDTSRYLRVWLDTRPGTLSHHQKTLVISKNDALVAFCGGLDLAFQRWDDERHELTSPNRLLPNPLSHPRSPDFNAGDTAPQQPEPLEPWHDVHVQIIGPAAHDIDANFRERWEDADFNPVGPDSEVSAKLFRQLDGINERSPTISRTNKKPNSLPAGPAQPIGSGTHYVKIARTYKTNTRNIFTMMQNIIHCIRRAKRLIYLEDQYLTSYHVADELKQQLSNKQDLIVIIVTGRMSDLPGAVTRRNRFLAVLNYNAYSNRVGVYHPINKHDGGHKIYVHSKMMIVDDIWAYVGTANLNHRSFAGDTEIGALVIDGEVKFGRRKFALELRKALWEEHLGRKFKYEELLDYSNAKLLWDKAIRDSNSHVALLLQNPEGEPKDYADLIVDPWDAGPIPDPDNPESPFLERR